MTHNRTLGLEGTLELLLQAKSLLNDGKPRPREGKEWAHEKRTIVADASVT